MGSNATEYFHYIPSESLAFMSMVTYSLLAVYLTTRMYTTKSASFLYILPVIAALQATGFLYRYFCVESTSIAKYITMSLFLILPPNALPLVNYMSLGKFIRSSNVQTKHFFLNPTFVTWFFFVINVLSFWIQKVYTAGETLAADDDLNVVYFLLDVCLNSILFSCFMFITTYVYQNPKYAIKAQNQSDEKGKLFFAIYSTAGLQFIRMVFLGCKYATGLDGPIASAEWAFYIFDTLPLMLSYVIYSILFIGDYLPKEDESKYQYCQLSRFDNMEEEDIDTTKHVAVFNNVQSVNYSIGSES